jgi:5-methylcytosine-specific restriction endonuclease McrA
MMLQAPVLLLNRNYQPIRVIKVRRALTMLYADVVRALDEQFHVFDCNAWSALSAHLREGVATLTKYIKVPRVVVFQVYDRIPVGRVRFSRNNIFIRDRLQCQYCTGFFPRHDLNLDRITPRSQAGKTNWVNVVTSCRPCNLGKGGRTPLQAHMKLMRQPTKPRWGQIQRSKRFPRSYQKWLPFLDPVSASYWNTELERDDNEP